MTTTDRPTIETVPAGRVYKGATPAAKRYAATLMAEFGPDTDQTRWSGGQHHPTALVAVDLRPVEGGVQAHLTWKTTWLPAKEA